MRVPSMPMTTLRWTLPRPSMSVPARMLVCCAVAIAGAQIRAVARRAPIFASMRMRFLLVSYGDGALLIAEAARRAEGGLLLSLPHRRQLLKPCPRRAEPELVAWNQLAPLTNRTDAQSDNFAASPHRSRVDRRATLGAERLLAFVPTLSDFDIDLRLPGKKSKSALIRRGHGAEG